MSKTPSSTKEERLAKALRENLARRKALVRAKRERGGASEPDASSHPADGATQGEASAANFKLRSGQGTD
jgi:hypothetical protein